MAWWRRRSARGGSEEPPRHALQPDPLEEDEEDEGELTIPEGSWRPYGPDLDERRQALAVELAAEVTIVAGRDEVDAEGRVWPWTVELYDDVRWLAGDAAIESLEHRLPGEVGVTEVVFEDREVLWVRGELDPVQLHGWIVAYLARTGDSEPDA